MKNRLHLLFYILPCLLWFYLIHAFYSNGYLNLIVDAKVNCIYTHYYLNHIMRGVYPFWNPFSSWGRPDDLLAHMMGEFNPFLYITVLLQKLGMRFSMAYFGYLIIYFTLGAAGVYFLAKQLFKDHVFAWLACVLAMYSNLGGNLFNNIIVILIFVPSIWFFYFFIKFIKTPQRSSFLGFIFCLMVLLTTYMPFHFLVIFLAFLVFYVCIYLPAIPSMIVSCFKFFIQNKTFTLFCFCSLLLSIIPGFLWYFSNIQGDVIYGWRGLQNSLQLDIGMLNSGSSINMHSLVNPISNLQDSELCSLYIPFIFILIGLLGMILPLTRRRILIFAMGIFFFLLTLTMASPLLKFLYQHVFFFKYFRNPHFFVWAFGILVILLTVDIFQGLIGLQPTKKHQRIGLCVFTLLVHLSVLIILNHCWLVNYSSYLTLALSGVFFISYFSGILKQGKPLFYLIVLVIFLLQPSEVLWHIEQRATTVSYFSYSLNPPSYQESTPKFNYLRPTLNEETGMTDTGHVGDTCDRSGFVKNLGGYQGTRWSLLALQDFYSNKYFQEYVRHKFVLYGPHQDLSGGFTGNFTTGQWIDHDSGQFKIENFDMNTIRFKTAFNQDHLLVYNDSFHAAWQAFINGKRVPVTRANMAFKGIYLPAGSNDVLFLFNTPFHQSFFIFLIFYFGFILLILIFLLFQTG